MKRTILLSLLLISCAKPKDDTLAPTIAGFEAEVEYFKQEANNRGIVVNTDGLSIVYGTTVGGYMAQCQSKKITVSKSAWDQKLPLARLSLLLHEMGHCVLNRQHRIDGFSIMNQLAPNATSFNDHRVELLDELFTHQ